jgi:L-cysteine:1D-myo-inositol 2-amino-2-deoxy-alpha-D-glucopyranoside ligase
MNSWPGNNLPLMAGYEFPTLKIIDSNLGLVTVDAPSEFRIYVCGITPYDSTHLGHAATYLAFDLINRYQSLSGRSLNFVENITDIDDPLLERAKRDNSNWQQLADTQTQLFKSDMSALRIIPPNNLVKVTESMAIIEDFIKKLDGQGYVYEISGDYYFSVEQFLSGLPVSISEAVKIFAERGGDPDRQGKKHQLDPLVWSANTEGEPGWESSFGFGRPGWHVECTAIACKYLDKDSNNPILHMQGGGSDLIFPHHFMSAQIVRAAYGRDFSQYFVHAAMIGLDGEKMSKSKGNLVFVSKLLSAGVDPMAIRWALLQGHYQKDREWSDNLLSESEIQIATVRRALAQSEVIDSKELLVGIIADLSNNLDTPSALKRLLSWSEQSINTGSINQSGLVSRSIDALLGLAL